MTTVAAAAARVTGRREQYINEDENLAAGAEVWTHFPGGMFTRSGPWFVDVTRGGPAYPYSSWRVMLTPAILPKDPGPARVGGDLYRHDPDPANATSLGEFCTLQAAVRAGGRWLKAHDSRTPQGEWIGRADW